MRENIAVAVNGAGSAPIPALANGVAKNAASPEPEGNGKSSRARGNATRSAKGRQTPASRRTGSKKRVNGHCDDLSELGRAASVDASGTSAAVNAPSAASCADRDACAEVASAPAAGKRPREIEAGTRAAEDETDWLDGDVGGDIDDADGEELLCMPLPEDNAGFVEEMHEHVNLFEVGKKLLQSEDLKISLRVFERFLDMRYGKATAQVEEIQQIVLDVPRPNRDREPGM